MEICYVVNIWNYKELLQLTNKQPYLKMGKGLKKHFSRKNIQIANKHMKRSSTSRIIKEMQVKTTMRHYLIPVA